MATTDPILTRAQEIVDTEFLPTEQALARARAEAQADAASRAANIRGVSVAEGELLRGIAPQISGAYSQAAQDTSVASAGFSAGMDAAVNASADKVNAELARLGAPAGQQLAHSNAGDVLHGLQGWIPSNALSASGAAFASAASLLPATAAGRGRDLAFLSQREAASRDKEYEAQIRELEGKKRAETTRTARELAADARADRAERTQRGYLALSIAKDLRSQAAAMSDITGTVWVVKGGKLVNTGTVAPGSEVVEATTKKANEAKKARAAAVKARGDAFASARSTAFSRARDLGKGTKVKNPRYRGSLTTPNEPEFINQKPSFQDAYAGLYDELADDLLRYAGASGKVAIKGRIDRMIRQALRAAGIVPASAPTGSRGDSSGR